MTEVSGSGGEEGTPQSPSSGVIPDAERKRMLAEAIQRQVVQGGRIESQSEFQAVVVHGQPVNHTLHVLLAIFTCGLWLIPWLVLGVVGGEKRTLVSIDEYGNALTQDLGKRR